MTNLYSLFQTLLKKVPFHLKVKVTIIDNLCLYYLMLRFLLIKLQNSFLLIFIQCLQVQNFMHRTNQRQTVINCNNNFSAFLQNLCLCTVDSQMKYRSLCHCLLHPGVHCAKTHTEHVYFMHLWAHFQKIILITSALF